MEEGLRESAEGLSVEQLLAAISRIDSALEGAEDGEIVEGGNEDLMDRCTALERRLEEEQSKRRQLELAYGSIISTTYELNKELVQLESTQKLRGDLLRAERQKQLLMEELENTKEVYERKLEEMGKGLGKARVAVALLDGNKEELARMTLVQLLAAEKQLLKALSVLHEVKSESQVKSESLCVICEERKLGVLLRPCNHVCACELCAGALTTCPICRSRISTREKIYIQ